MFVLLLYRYTPVIIILYYYNYIGVTVKAPCGEVTSKARLLLSSFDLPARASVLNMKLFNGKFACAYCEDEGVPRASSHTCTGIGRTRLCHIREHTVHL